MTPAISARGLEKRFGPVIALRGVDLEVESGGALALLGANGAGKSTLLKILAGLAAPTRGTLEIDGLPYSASNADGLRARVGFVGHNTLLYSELTARENLLFAARLYSLSDGAARATQLLDEMGLSNASDRRVGQFSRGMAQRLAIARALVGDPRLVLLDEPFSGLDRLSADRLALRLHALREAGRTLVLVTHDLRQACAVASSALILARGDVAHRAAGPTLDRDALERAIREAVHLKGRAA